MACQLQPPVMLALNTVIAAALLKLRRGLRYGAHSVPANIFNRFAAADVTNLKLHVYGTCSFMVGAYLNCAGFLALTCYLLSGMTFLLSGSEQSALV